jgi:hypothetical protein
VGERPRRLKRVLQHVRNAGSWTRYARLVLLRPGSTAEHAAH